MRSQKARPPRHEPGGRQCSAIAYAGTGSVPTRYWRLITLSYPSGQKVTLVYANEPTDPSELLDLMLKLQLAAGRHGFTIQVTDADGTTTAAHAIPLAGSW